ncbi:histidine--tRNA ligase [Candidatus Parcubacteria bacterium]|jgi:histidyl-tRNA synthetase|nr:MAG: histidine--tRNA ligase [Candidatus Parcubacteria bacterium]
MLPKKTPAPEVFILKKGKTPNLVRGMKDILPVDWPWWNLVMNKVVSIASDFGFERIETPILEEQNLFVRSVGKDTDIIEKEMFVFTDRGGDNIALRPEGTASVVRAYLEHGFMSLPQPIKLFYLGPMFRYDRPQSGRYRQFWQFGFEIIGDGHPVVDAETVALGATILQELGLPVKVQINSVGDAASRIAYVKVLTEYLKSRKSQLCEDCKKRMLKNPMRVLDCKVETCQTLVQDAPAFLDHLSEEAKEHFTKVLEHLDDMEVVYDLNPRIVRGLDYYTHTAFEYIPADDVGTEKQQSALGGGGRYDGLVETFGGRPTPAIGFACGIERVIIQMKARGIQPPTPPRPDVFLAQLGDAARKKTLKLFREFRALGVKVAATFSKTSIKTQLEAANRLRAPFTLILGQKEMVDGTVLVRDMESGIQEVIDFSKAIPEIQKRIKKTNGDKIILNPEVK